MTKDQYKQALVDSGGVSEQKFKEAVREAAASKRDIPSVLIDQGVLSDKQIGQLMASWYGVNFVNVHSQAIASELLEMIPESFARSQNVIPLMRKDDSLIMAVTDPNDVLLKSLLEKYTRTNITFVYATPRDIKGNLFRFRQDPRKAFTSILEKKEKNRAYSTKIVELVDQVLEYAYQYNASDIHIEPEDHFTVIRYRVDGILKDMTTFGNEYHKAVITRLKVLAKLPTDEHRSAMDGRIKYESRGGDKVEVRLSIVPTIDGEKAVMRLLSDKSSRYNLTDLGFSARDLSYFKDTIAKPWGMILVTGPTGSGKTTTLYGAIKVLNKRSVNISTIEDPVEYDIDGVNQIQVNDKTNLTFAKGLRALVRQDPDIIMVGEIRDEETAAIAVNAAMTGHLVFSSLHTNDAATAIPRLLDMGIEDFLIASTLLTIVAQRLVRRICMSCIESHMLSDNDKALIAHIPEMEGYLLEQSGKSSLDEIRFFTGKGCKTCQNTGYSGRTGVFEVMGVTDDIRKAIMHGKNSDQIRTIAVEQGMSTMLRDGLAKMLLGHTTLEEVIRVTKE